MAIFPTDYVEKTTIAANDMILFSDSEDGDKLKKAKYSNLKGEKGDTGETGATGATGPQGPAGAAGADGTSFVREGAYSAGTTYQVNDTVSYNGSSYICILESTGNLPTNATYWALMAQKGTDGEGAGDMLKATYDPTNVAGDAFDMDNMAQGDTKKYVSATDITNLGNLSGTNSGDETTTTLGSKINGADAKTTPVDADMVGLMDSAASNILKKLSWSNIKATLKTYFDTLYQTILSKASGSEVDTGTDDTKYVTSKSIADSKVSYTDGTETLTNKRITKRVGSTTSSATPTINTDNYDVYIITAQAEDITSFTTNLSGTPTDGQQLLISITGTAARAITWGTSFEASTIALPTTTVTTKRLDVGFIWNVATSKWRCVGVV